ncbi:hypothetical protein CEXT_309481 [Caerostris extrusa]|uniref:Secreted protein n=1 Tax=Caerostris extrusa TaxID=172846 RepID=A0AAV4RJL6_CAEEX|nr:hypothetical protein CEXT_309481 [Caerostris extrusa]
MRPCSSTCAFVLLFPSSPFYASSCEGGNRVRSPSCRDIAALKNLFHLTRTGPLDNCFSNKCQQIAINDALTKEEEKEGRLLV